MAIALKHQFDPNGFNYWVSQLSLEFDNSDKQKCYQYLKGVIESHAGLIQIINQATRLNASSCHFLAGSIEVTE